MRQIQYNYETVAQSNIGICPACAETGERLLRYKQDHAYSQCAGCGSIYLATEAADNSVRELYDRYYERARFEIAPAAAASLERLVESFETFRETGCWLDIGYGEGGLLSVADRKGWNCYGTELSPQALSHGQERGWIVANGEDDPRFPRAGFDVVTMIEFLEHVPTPYNFLRAAARWLRPGGLLYITTPNADSLNRRFLGLRWSIFSPPEHMTIWTARGLDYALTKAGFRVERVRTDGLNPCEIIARVRHRNQPAQPVDRNAAALTLNNAFSSSPFRRAIKTGINHCLSALKAGDTLKVWAVRGNKEIEKP